MEAVPLLGCRSHLSADLQQQHTVRGIRQMDCAVTLADPSLPDCPLIGCSGGFERITGYSKKETIGQNCRFLSNGINAHPQVRLALRSAAAQGGDFFGVLLNRRRNGELFDNLLYMTSMHVQGHRYVLGVSMDVTHADLQDAEQVEEIRRVRECIIEENISAWIKIQARQFELRLPPANNEVMRRLVRGGLRQYHRSTPKEVLVEEAFLKRTASDVNAADCADCSADILEDPTFVSTASSEGSGDGFMHSPEARERPECAWVASATVLSLTYGSRARSAESAPMADLIFTVGQQVSLVPQMDTKDMSMADRNKLLSGLTFSVTPPLPLGLTLDPKSGIISGTAMSAEERTLHEVRVSTCAVGPGGIDLGLGVLAKELLAIRVEDLRRFHVREVLETADEHGNEKFIVKYAPNA